MKCPKCDADNTDAARFCSNCATSLRGAEKAQPLPTQTIETPREELTTGSTFAGRYQIIEELGRGGMGKVYKVIDTRIHEKIALKLIKPEISSDRNTLERFGNELKLARKIAHKNVGKMFDINEEEGTHYITMEYVSGQDLKGLIRQTGQLAIGTSVSIAKQICEGLSEAHKLGVVHRDLKPNNIMIDREGEVRIMDFGIARSIKAKGITGAGVMIGTPEYMSPEQAEAKDVDPRSDLYSLGVILYEMLTGRVPFEGETALSIAMKHKGDSPRNPKELNPQIPDDFCRLVLKCLVKDREKRYQNAEELFSELNNIEKGIPPNDSVALKKKPVTSKEISVTFKKPWKMIAVLIVVAIAAAITIAYFPRKRPILPPAQKKLVVLPFKNLGPPEDEFFADGITEEIRARLTRIEGLGMIARTSAYKYKNTEKNIGMIGEELGVDYVLDGTIRWQRSPDGPSRVRVTPELIRASDSTNLWTDVYDKGITDIFEVQSAIAEQVAGALDITLGEEKLQALKTRPTASMDAYNYYLHGIDYFERSYEEENMRLAVQMFEKAIEADPSFALAYAHLTRAYSQLYWLYYFRVDQGLLEKAEQAVNMALELSPDSAETQWALGYYYYYCHMAYNRALEHFDQAQKGLGNSSNILLGIAAVQRRQGKFEEAAEKLKQLAELDPYAQNIPYEIGVTYHSLRNYPEAERFYDRAISLAPDVANPHAMKIQLYLNWEGDTQKARLVWEGAPPDVRSSEGTLFVLNSILLNVFDGEYLRALERLSSLSTDVLNFHSYFIPKSLLLAGIYGFNNQPDSEKKHYDMARSFLEGKIQEWAEDSRVHSSLGMAYAGLGRKEEAIREGKLGVELLPVSKDALRGPPRLFDLAHIYVMVGEYDAAIELLELLLSIPSEISIPWLKLDPAFRPIRDNPRFQKLLKQGK